jgi:SAM-dependent methyltransferase
MVGINTMSNNESLRRKESFDAVAASYAEYRSPPPPEVVATIIRLANLRKGSTVLEIGCGTGQLSVALAEHGVALTAVELGPHLADRARQNLARFESIRIETAAFESWPLPLQKFDAVVCANAFHWLDPHLRSAKCAAALRPGGFLEILHVHHVGGGTLGFFADTQPLYVKWGMSDDPLYQLPAPTEVPAMYEELDSLPEFCSVQRHRFEIPTHHTTQTYIGWLMTDSLVNTLDDASKRGFLHDMQTLIKSKYGGEVTRNYVYEVIVAERTA